MEFLVRKNSTGQKSIKNRQKATLFHDFFFRLAPEYEGCIKVKFSLINEDRLFCTQQDTTSYSHMHRN